MKRRYSLLLLLTFLGCGDKEPELTTGLQMGSMSEVSIFNYPGYTTPDNAQFVRISLKSQGDSIVQASLFSVGEGATKKECTGSRTFTIEEKSQFQNLFSSLKICKYSEPCSMIDGGSKGSMAITDPSYLSHEGSHIRQIDAQKTDHCSAGTEFYICGGKDDLYAFIKNKIKIDDTTLCPANYSSWF